MGAPRSSSSQRGAIETRRFDVGLVPFRSPLLRNSLLVSLTPDSDMLKFSGYPAAPGCHGPERPTVAGRRPGIPPSEARLRFVRLPRSSPVGTVSRGVRSTRCSAWIRKDPAGSFGARSRPADCDRQLPRRRPICRPFDATDRHTASIRHSIHICIYVYVERSRRVRAVRFACHEQELPVYQYTY